jgi:hypothetical protein
MIEELLDGVGIGDWGFGHWRFEVRLEELYDCTGCIGWRLVWE